MTQLHALVKKNAQGMILCVIRSYESHTRAEQDMLLIEEHANESNDYYDIIEIKHIEA